MFVCSGWIWTGSYWSNERWKLASTKTSKQFSIAVKVAIPGIVFITKRINSRTEIPHCCCRNLWHVSILNITCSSMGFHSSPSQKGGSSARKKFREEDWRWSKSMTQEKWKGRGFCLFACFLPGKRMTGRAQERCVWLR